MGPLPMLPPRPNHLPTSLGLPAPPGYAPGYPPTPGSSAPAASSSLSASITRPLPRSYTPITSSALSDFIDFQTMMASSRYLHLKDKKRVSVAKTSCFSAMLTAALTAIPVTISAINGQSEKVFLIPILGTLAAIHGAMLGLLLNHDQD